MRLGSTHRAWGRPLAIVATLVTAAGSTACERIIDVELDEGPTRLVVEGRIELVKENPTGDQAIRLTTTDEFFSNAPTPPATGAAVVVTDDQGGVFPLAETSPGTYTTASLPAAIGRTYSISIDWEGDTYTASATAGAVPPIDRLYFVFEEETLITEIEGYRSTIDFIDPSGVENFYLWEQIVDGRNELLPDPGNAFNLISKDEFYDGQAVLAYQPNDEVAIELGQRVEIRQVALSRAAYDYYLALFEQNALGSGDPFSIPPANIRGNVRNETTPDRRALGYFEAAEVSVATAVVTDDGGS
ncbi:MAG: DUF4249 domain-containing protein [Gemmatimonadota bacterium]|nr:DUF4249 domain-containing protein [Gemmatimonadota bacterium]